MYQQGVPNEGFDYRLFASSSHAWNATPVYAQVENDLAHMMLRVNPLNDYQIEWHSCSKEMADRHFIDAKINYVMKYFKESGCIFTMLYRQAYTRAMPSTVVMEKAVVFLRLQYISVFVLYYLTTIRPELYRTVRSYLKFRTQVQQLRYIIDHNPPEACYSLINRIVDQTRFMTEAVVNHPQTIWKKMPNGSSFTAIEMAVEFLAMRHQVSAKNVAKMLGVYLPNLAASPQHPDVQAALRQHLINSMY